MMSKDELLDILYSEEEEICTREFDCLVSLVEDGTISTLSELQSYGVGNKD